MSKVLRAGIFIFIVFVAVFVMQDLDDVLSKAVFMVGCALISAGLIGVNSPIKPRIYCGTFGVFYAFRFSFLQRHKFKFMRHSGRFITTRPEIDHNPNS